MERQMSRVGCSMANKPWPDEMEMFEPYVTGIMWFKKLPDTKAVADAFEKHLWPCHRFNSCIEGSKWVRRHESMDREYHFVEMDMPEEKAIEEFGMKTQLTSLLRDHPQWKVFLLRTPAHQSAVLMHLHHALGDGLGLLFATSPLMGVQEGHPLANIPLPRAILPPFARKPEDATPKRRDSTAHRGFFANCCCGFFRGVRNFMRGFFVMLATSYDSDLPVNAPLTQRRPRLKFSGKRRLTRLPTVPLSTVKRARENHDVTLNDIVMAAVTGAIRRYCVHKGDTQLTEGRPVECKSMLMLALPRECDISNPTIALQNKMLFSSVRLPVQEGTRAGRVKKMAEACSDLKSMAYMMGLKFFTNLASMSPRAFLNKATGESWSKHSFLITNVPSTTGPMTWPKGEGGEQLQGITMVIANVMNQVSVISYNGELYSSLVSDPDVIDEEAEFCKIWLSEFEALADPMKNDTDGVVRP